jgi:transcriptional regulator with XRE-family HTH domain
MDFKTFVKQKGSTQQALADALGVHQTLVSQWCTGKCKPNVHQISKIASTLNASVGEVVDAFEHGGK